MEVLASLNWFAVFVAAFVHFILGAAWYSPSLFGRTWMNLKNMTEEDTSESNPMLFVYTFFLQLIAVISLALFLSAMDIHTATGGAIAGFGAGTGLVFTLTGTTGLFSSTPLKLHFIDNGYHVVGLTLAGLILGWW